jgi:hypothetical protein
VALTDVNETALRQVTDDLTAAGHQVLGVTCDVSDEEQVAAMVQAAVVQFGRLALGKLPSKLAQLQRPHLLPIDEAGYLPLDRADANRLFQGELGATAAQSCGAPEPDPHDAVFARRLPAQAQAQAPANPLLERVRQRGSEVLGARVGRLDQLLAGPRVAGRAFRRSSIRTSRRTRGVTALTADYRTLAVADRFDGMRLRRPAEHAMDHWREELKG